MKKQIACVLSTIMACAMLCSCTGKTEPQMKPAESDVTSLGLNAESKEATQYTKDANDKVYALLDFDDKTEYENASKGLITSPEKLEIYDENGKLVWSQAAYSFIESDSPDTANPSLWRNTQLNHTYGLFEVADGIYQVRGYDMTNITFVKGDSGWIVFDPLMTSECSRAALELVNENLGEYPIKAVIFSHSHVDHFGGIEGILTEEQVEKEEILLIAPENYEEYVVSENVYAGTAMARRASYQYGSLLEKGEKGALGIGIGMGQSNGTTGYISPNTDITETGQELEVDGVKMVFQLTPGTEAPAEMNTWFPEKKALWLAENCTGTLHNLYTLRGAEVRDGNAWAEYLMESLALYGEDVEVVFQSHNWPHWGNETINKYITDTAAVYKFINDQTLLYINEGYTETEISNMLALPEELEKVWYTRQYYGTVAHNAKAVYEKYMGWYDANPVHLAELEPTEQARKFVEYMGDPAEILEKAKSDYDKGEYQWVAEITNILVYNDPDNMDARYLCADALEQLGYQSESGTWRNVYLCAAQELRYGTNTDPNTRISGANISDKMTPPMIFEFMGIKADTMAIQDLSFTAQVELPDISYTVTVKNGVILYQEGITSKSPDVIWNTNTAGLLSIAENNKEGIEKFVHQEGDTELTDRLSEAMTDFSEFKFFNIIEP
ncbi:alkyl/aryl-sulfatase [uncultured Ruminococcus sp.]|uniref:alkyl/aryl-sulfatase n=1 Tax=uncultured Ruminococcus sp. TaxID=165186 RepID=UPI00261B7F4C|nr:alkyl sulfatase dimerization domain-containing protein [uncultured Ruminococcus sp.]